MEPSVAGSWASLGVRIELGSGEEAGLVLGVECADVESVEKLRDELVGVSG